MSSEWRGWREELKGEDILGTRGQHGLERADRVAKGRGQDQDAMAPSQNCSPTQENTQSENYFVQAYALQVLNLE